MYFLKPRISLIVIVKLITKAMQGKKSSKKCIWPAKNTFEIEISFY